MNANFGFNTNILETNVLNLAPVIGIVVYFGGDILRGLLTARQKAIQNTIDDAEKKYKTALKQLHAAEQQFSIAKSKAEEIRAQGKDAAAEGARKFTERAEEDITRLEETKQLSLRLEEQKAMQELCQKVVSLALLQVREKLQNRLDASLHKRVNDIHIALFERL
uniref:ATP synthase subunit b, chloroplastic n=1 Tax=Picocystis salinarum TaxID=88271 RepID=A0A088CJ48_9CHLO|nr:CF0 subunit I of ATP synthase [Picocystis salinarum]AID67581.1 CF0 subunit I of ATP synthase [Picocystis salinarum]|mmetsp:Transcript_5934/g.36788  ORF Transcript_5934/g.36788 Transcript_5934/m.36788 type:complete len:165 (-) Transcript_5934:1536-2030(-)